MQRVVERHNSKDILRFNFRFWVSKIDIFDQYAKFLRVTGEVQDSDQLFKLEKTILRA